MHYQMPPNDPRFLAITDEEIAHDLLVIRMRRRMTHLALHPSEADADDPETAAKDAEERTIAFLADPKVDKGIQALLARGRTAPAPEPGATSIRLRRSTPTGDAT